MIYYAVTNNVKFMEAYSEQYDLGEVYYKGNVWFVDHIDDAKLFKTRAGAQKAVDSVPSFNLKVVEVEVTRTVVPGGLSARRV